ncbi:MAG: hypothetical protein ABW022_00200 [Actinoplanes sp.]
MGKRGPKPKPRPAPIIVYKHEYEEGKTEGRGRCLYPVPSKGQKQWCGLAEDNPLHRFYVCRHCGQNDFASVEMKDRHEANEHGSGW